MVLCVEGDACHVAALQRTAAFKALLGAVVAGLAQALQVQGVEEQRPVPLVWGDVIDNRCRCSDFKLKAIRAEGLCLKLVPAKSFPFCGAV